MVAPDPRIEPYLKQSGFWHVAQMVAPPTHSVLVERWRSESHTFHLPFRECTIGLEDVVFQLGLRVDRLPMSGYTFGALPHNAYEETIIRYTRAYIMILLGGVLFSDKSSFRAWYKIPQLAPRHHHPLTFPLTLRWKSYRSSTRLHIDKLLRYRRIIDSIGINGFRWMPYNNNKVRNLTPRFVYDEADIWAFVTALIQFAVIEWHPADHVVQQFGGAQHIRIVPINIDQLHAKDGRGDLDIWWSEYHVTWHAAWEARRE
ncbi:serine/threonine-protein phosphatase 7 long form homolog [Abrus precatorius]|uniref:Serine/threonine-protein phosphatase 7 long form homolog n=1 Tax=Abrus precatorius TaxID=3816 RepID=A0A8B8LSE9_ABRPR|nr:serine/threonine-protein phosphatase 7 long form homolog [Abrus precatorius]